MSCYIVDSNFFIQAHRKYYPFDVVESFWQVLIKLANNKTIISIDKVKDELYRNDDELSLWCKEFLPVDFFKASESSIFQYSNLAKWANTKRDRYSDFAIEEFLTNDVADAWIISYALHNEYNIVTEEVKDTSKKRIKMPDVCEQFGVKYHNTMNAFRALNVKF